MLWMLRSYIRWNKLCYPPPPPRSADLHHTGAGSQSSAACAAPTLSTSTASTASRPTGWRGSSRRPAWTSRWASLQVKPQDHESKAPVESQIWNLPPCLCLGVVNVLTTTPLWVVNTRLKLQGSKFRSADIQPTNYAGIFGKTLKSEPVSFHSIYCQRFLLPDAFFQIIRDEGVGALWNGTFPSLLLVLNPAIQFMIYEGLKRQLKKGIPREVSEEGD